jgi:hypothetical protein
LRDSSSMMMSLPAASSDFRTFPRWALA